MADKTLSYNSKNILTNDTFKYNIPDCYIYLYHTDEYFIIPQYPETVDDTMSSSFSQQNTLARTAPVFAYQNSGPREITFTFDLHRDMMNDLNKTGSNVRLNRTADNTVDDVITSINDDYVDILIKKLQSISLPRYKAANREIDPPRVAIRLGKQIFIKGVVNSAVRVMYKLPLLENEKYAQINVSFSVFETTPYDADSVGFEGSFRGVTSGLRAKIGG